jgi:hypothetical protein
MPDIVRRARLTSGTNQSTTSLVPYDHTYGQPGMYAPMVTSGTNSATAVANRGFLCRFVPSRNMTAALIGFTVSTAAGADDNVDVGIYSAAGAKLVSSGATAGKLNSQGAKTVAITATPLTAGTVYYGALSFGALGGTAAVVTGVGYQSVFAFAAMGATIGLVEADAKAAQHPLPDPWGALSGLTAVVPWLAIRES